MERGDNREAKRNEKALAELHKLEHNRKCADCQALGTRWASWNLGVFLCIRCGGIHRRLGTHISKVKSLTLDNWTDDQVASMAAKGNERVNAQLNPHPERHPFPSFAGDAEQYIRDKYERRLFVEGALPRQLSLNSANRSNPQSNSTNLHNPSSSRQYGSPSAARGPSSSQHYGFAQSSTSNAFGSYEAAERYSNGISVDGGIENYIYPSQMPKVSQMTSTHSPAAAMSSGPMRLGVPKTTASSSIARTHADFNRRPSEEFPSQIATLIEMGFTDMPANRRVLQECRGNVQAAVEELARIRGSTPSPIREEVRSVFERPNHLQPVIDDVHDPFEELRAISKGDAASSKSPIAANANRGEEEERVFDTLFDVKKQTPLSKPVEDLAEVFGAVQLHHSSSHQETAAIPSEDDFAEFESAPQPVAHDVPSSAHAEFPFAESSINADFPFSHQSTCEESSPYAETLSGRSGIDSFAHGSSLKTANAWNDDRTIDPFDSLSRQNEFAKPTATTTTTSKTTAASTWKSNNGNLASISANPWAVADDATNSNSASPSFDAPPTTTTSQSTSPLADLDPFQDHQQPWA